MSCDDFDANDDDFDENYDDCDENYDYCDDDFDDQHSPLNQLQAGHCFHCCIAHAEK